MKRSLAMISVLLRQPEHMNDTRTYTAPLPISSTESSPSRRI